MPPRSQSAPAGAVPGRCVGPARQRTGRASCGRGWAPPGDPPPRVRLRAAHPPGRVCGGRLMGGVCVVNRSSVAAGSVNPGGSAADTDPSVRAVRGDPCRAALRISRDAAQSPSLQRSCSPPAFPPASCSQRAPSPSSLAGGKGEMPAWTSAAPTQFTAAGWRRLCTAQTGRPGEEPPRSVGLPCPPHATRFPHGRATAGGGASHEGRAR